METVLQDVRHGIRLLVRAPGFTLITLIALAAGIGANATVVSVANALLLRPLPVEEPSRVVRLFAGRHSNIPFPDMFEYGRATRTLEGLVPFRGGASVSLRTGANAPEPFFAEFVGGDYFDMLGVRAALGRTFLPTEGRTPGSSPIAVLTHHGWRRKFGGDAGAIGREAFINGQAFTIVGVMPPEFTGMSSPIVPDVFIPLMMDPVIYPGSTRLTKRESSGQMFGRMKPGVTIAQVQAEMNTIHQSWQRDRAAAGAAPGAPGTSAEASDLRPLTVYAARTLPPEFTGRIAVFVGLLAALSAMVLLIACLNVTNLLLSRSTARVSQLGIRLAIGASRGRVIRQLLTESALLAIGGGAIGVAVAYGLTGLINRITLPAPVPIVFNVTPDWRVMIATFAVSMICALGFGLAPALMASRGAVAAALRRDSNRGSGHGRSRLRALFLVSQVSLSLVLLVVAALLVQSVMRAGALDVGFRQDHVLSLTVDLSVRGYKPDTGRAFYRTLEDRFAALPGVRAVNLVDTVPLTLSNSAGPMIREGMAPPPPDRRDGLVMVYNNTIGPGHFDTLRIPLLAGRDFTRRDTENTAPVVIINETLAHAMWPGEHAAAAVGRRLRRYHRNARAGEAPPPMLEVVGVVRNSKYVTVGEEPRPFLFFPFEQQGFANRASVLMRVEGDPAVFAATARAAVRAIDPDLPLFDLMPLSDQTSVSLLPIRLAASFLGGLGLVVLALAALGLYGVLSFLVRLRTKEIGIRMALGADGASVLRTVLSDAGRWLAWGLGVGLALALVLTPLVASMLYGVAPRDWATFLAVSALLTAVGLAASIVPALRASRVDPLTALRAE
jgi:putative ABC transport system permease protein